MTVATMTIRAARQRNVVLAIVGASMLVSLLLLSQTHSRLRRTEEDLERCQQKQDSVAAQLTVLYEHKARLEKTLQAEIERKKLIDDEFKTMQSALSKEKIAQGEKFSKMMHKADELKVLHEVEINKNYLLSESLHSCKNRLDADVADLTVQAQKLRETNHKLEEEVRKMQQSVPIDMNEVERLQERVRQCDADQANRQAEGHGQAQVGQVAAPAAEDRPADDRRLKEGPDVYRLRLTASVESAGDSKSTLNNVTDKAKNGTSIVSAAPDRADADSVTWRSPEAITAGQVPLSVSQTADGNAGAIKNNDSLTQGGVPDETKVDMAVLPVPQGRNSGVSSTARPALLGPEAIDAGNAPAAADPAGDDNKGPAHVPIDSMQQVDAALERKRFFGHQFGQNADRNEKPKFRVNNGNPIEGEERDYVDNFKDDDAGPDDGEEGGGGNENKNNVNNKHQLQPPQEEDNDAGRHAHLEEVINDGNDDNQNDAGKSAKANPDFGDANLNLNEVDAPRGVKVLPK